MPGKAYSAGTIFLQVVPVFRDAQNQIRGEARKTAKALGDEMEKGGRDAGKRASKAMGEELSKGADGAGEDAGKQYGGSFEKSVKQAVKNAQKEIDGINFSTASENTLNDLEKVKRKLKDLSSDSYDIDVDTKRAIHDVGHLEALVKRLVKGDHELNIEANLQKVLGELEVVSKTADRVAAKKREIRFESNIETLERQMGRFEKQTRASAKSAAASLGDNLSPEIQKIKKQLQEISDSDFGIDLSTDQARERVAALARELKLLAQNEEIDVNVRADTGAAYADLIAINEFGNRLDGKHWDVTLGVDTKAAERDMGAFEAKIRKVAATTNKQLGDGVNRSLDRIKSSLADIADPHITPELNAEHVIAEMRGLSGELRAMATDTNLDVDVRVNAREAYTELVPLMAAFSAIDGRKLNVEVDLDAGKAAAEAGMLNAMFQRLTGGGDNAANSFRAFNFIILAAVTLLPALVPILAAVGGGLAALIPILGAVGAGVGVMIAGFSGIGPVIKGFSDVQKNAGQDALVAGKRIRSSARGVEDAERSLARARQSAAQSAADAARQVARAQEQARRSIQDALKAQKRAQDDYRQSVEDTKDAVQNLRAARKQAQDDLNQAKDDRARNALDVRQGLVDVFNATVQNNAVQQDGSSTNLDKETASIALERAKLALKEARDEQKKLADEKAKSDKQGINGSDAVKTAQDKLTAAIKAQKDAQDAVKDSSIALTRAQVDGARAIADAQRNQHEAAVAGAQAVADAQRNLTQAQEDYTTAVSETSTSVRNLNDALSKVGPAGERFARFIFGLRDEALALRNSIQEAMLPGVQAGLQKIINTYGPQFQSFATRMGAVMGGIFKQAGQGLGQEPWREFFGTYSKIAPRLLQEFAQTTGNWMGVYARFFTIVAPYAERFSLALLAMSQNALGFMQSGKGAEFWTRFMDYAAKVGPEVAHFFWSFFQAIVAIAVAIAPWGETVMNALSGIFDWISAMDPQTLGFIATGIIGIVLAFQAATGAVALAAGGIAVFTNPLALLVFTVIALSTAIYAAYQNSAAFRNVVDKIGSLLSNHIGVVKGFAVAVGALGAAWLAYRGYLATLLVVEKAHWAALLLQEKATKGLTKATELWNALQVRTRAINLLVTASVWAQNAAWLANPITWVVLAIVALIGIFVLLYKHNEHVRKAVNALWDALKSGAKAVWNFIAPILSAIGAAFVWLWEKAIQPSLSAIGHFFVGIFKAMGAIWTGYLWPIFDLIFHIYKLFWTAIVKPYLTLIWNFWKAVFHGMAWVWNHILKPVFSLMGAIIRDLWNKTAKPVFGWIGDRFKWIGDRFAWVWKNLIKPVFDAFKDHVLPALKTAFGNVVDWISDKWASIKELFAAPIRFVIEKIINGGIIRAFNWVAGKVGSTPMDPVPVPKFLQAPKGKARGGTLRSASDYNVYPGYTPGRDIGYIGISGGEGILRPEATRALGHDTIARINAAAIQGGVEGVKKRLGYYGGFANGGVTASTMQAAATKKRTFWPVPGHETGTYPGHNGVDINRGSGSDDYGDPIWAFRDGTITYVGTGRGYGEAIMERGPGFPEVVYGHTSAQYVHSGQSVKAGDLIGRVGSTGNSSAPHLHFGLVSGGTTANALALLQGAVMKGGIAKTAFIPGWVQDLISAPAKWLAGKVKEPINNFFDKFGDSGVTQAVVGLGKKLFGGVGDKLKDMATGFKDKLESAAAAGGSFVGGIIKGALGLGSSTTKVKEEVSRVAVAYGWGQGAEWDAIDFIVSHESGWDPEAKNPGSSAMGLFQKMTSIHGPIEHTVGGQAKWGMQYIRDRYGDPLAAKRFWESHGNYADGGVVPTSAGVPDNGTMMYDNGGYLPPGLTTVLNLTGKPEPVFTADQFDNMGGGRGGITYAPTFNKSDLTARDVADDMNFQLRRLDRVGTRYGGDDS